MKYDEFVRSDKDHGVYIQSNPELQNILNDAAFNHFEVDFGANCHFDLFRCMQQVHISKTVKMIDSPGIVAMPSNSPVSMALRSLQVEEKEESPLEAVRTLLKQCNEQQVRC